MKQEYITKSIYIDKEIITYVLELDNKQYKYNILCHCKSNNIYIYNYFNFDNLEDIKDIKLKRITKKEYYNILNLLMFLYGDPISKIYLSK